MLNLSLNDKTQNQLITHLETTEQMLSGAISQAYDMGDVGVEIAVLPDLGVSANEIRMAGGFFTGMFACWDCEHPFVPVDATINSCGVSIFVVDPDFGVDDFKHCLKRKTEIERQLGYKWNFETGNHFVTLGEFASGGRCIVSHSSAAEYKKGNVETGLYPEAGNWFWNEIKTYSVDERYLRYIQGSAAEKFIMTAMKLPAYNKTRHERIISFIFGSYIEDDYLFSTHYGMPTPTSLAIGCIWEAGDFPLLTAPGHDLFIIRPTNSERNSISAGDEGNFHLFPHGYGSMLNDDVELTYSNNHIAFNGCFSDDFYYSGDYCQIRGLDGDTERNRAHADRVLNVCPGEIVDTILPIATISKRGFQTFPERSN